MGGEGLPLRNLKTKADLEEHRSSLRKEKNSSGTEAGNGVWEDAGDRGRLQGT